WTSDPPRVDAGNPTNAATAKILKQERSHLELLGRNRRAGAAVIRKDSFDFFNRGGNVPSGKERGAAGKGQDDQNKNRPGYPSHSRRSGFTHLKSAPKVI
ncbi:MAG: hypothetical protein MK294_09755, partial [Rhodospirillales bacterium]|nr:hypothetical protein [Rhodospirillales bacterium]